MKILIAIGVAIITFIIVTMWSCLIVASREDERLEKLDREQKK